MKVAMIGHRYIDASPELVQRVNDVILNLVEKENADTFLFGSKSEFNDLCYDVVTEIKNKYPYIKRVKVRAEYEYADEDYLNYILTFYEEAIFPEGVRGAGALAYVKRNEALVNMCDVLVAYYDLDYQPPVARSSGTRFAFNYADRKNKRIINVFM